LVHPIKNEFAKDERQQPLSLSSIKKFRKTHNWGKMNGLLLLLLFSVFIGSNGQFEDVSGIFV
jgi:hypothetical protein